MRSEREMMDLILTTARADERIRAVIINGSRANPNAPRDFFQDYDVVYIVTNPAPFRRNFEWIERFGELMILQCPDDMGDTPAPDDAGFAYLMQFADGNRMDLTICPLDDAAERYSDSQTIVLLDKDGLIPPLDPAGDRDYLPEPPTAKQFADCCNEFWWVSVYVAKGLWREEFLYARHTLDAYVRHELMKMLTWHIGVRTDFTCAPGKHGKYVRRYLEPDLWEMLLATYADADADRNWDALITMSDLFRRVVPGVADHFGFDYNHEEDRRVTAHLHHVRNLPRDAAEMY